jgi:hypothetical protein
MRFPLTVALVFLGLTGAVSAQSSFKYGQTNIYKVQFNKHGACVAMREIGVRASQGNRKRKGAFGFGISQVDGKEFALVSFFNPAWKMEKGQVGKGHVSIDGNDYKTVFWADSASMLSAALNLDKLKNIAFGSKLIFDTGLERYSVPLTGTAKALPMVVRCYKDNFANRTNPLGTDAGASDYKTRTTNPLGNNYR